ncbi:MAG: amylo-alpha-1,6-glucosidase [archaeon]
MFFLHVIHSFNNVKVDEHTSKETAFLITNKKGNYLSLGQNNFSSLQGLFFFDHKSWSYHKTIEDIRLEGSLEGSDEMVAIKNNLFNVARSYKSGAEESFSLFNNSMLYSLWDYSGEVVIDLDFRPMYDHDDQGRIYKITREDDLIVIRYDKFSDNSLSRIDRTSFLAIKGADDFRDILQWIKKDYSYDARRGSRAESYVYRALAIRCSGKLDLAFSFSDDKESAKTHARQVYENRDYLKNSMKKYAAHTFTSEDIALNAAMKALDDLTMSVERQERSVGVFAGLPWFFQFWARDELISLKALLLQEKYPLVKSILFKYLASLSEDGLIPNRLPDSGVRSIDASGWLFLRLREFINALANKKMIDDYLDAQDLFTIKQALDKAILGLMHHHTEKTDGFIVCKLQESWMDTKSANREGACIEVQALFLAMLKLHNELAKVTKSKQVFKGLEKDLRESVRNEFFKDGYLLDCINEPAHEDGSKARSIGVIRPNIFLAYYIYPELLSKAEWKQAFDNALKVLWLDWGGLATISHTDPKFCAEYTGENDISYHNGDSWYYINNYAAIALHRLDSNYYEKQIARIVHASRDELLFSGFIGCGSELSSAKQERSEGCLSQAWSNASFIELMKELGTK